MSLKPTGEPRRAGVAIRALWTALLAAVWGLLSVSTLLAADEKPKPRLLVSEDPSIKPAALPQFWLVRPNVEQGLQFSVQNPLKDPVKVVVEVKALGQGGLTAKSAVVTVPGKATAPVPLGKLPAAAPPKEGAAPWPELSGATPQFEVRLLDDLGAPLDKEPQGIGVDLKPFSSYLDLTKITFTSTRNSNKNQLSISLKAGRDFSGPPCKVNLVLRPDRIPGLRKSGPGEGTYERTILPGEKDEVTLFADNLQFAPGASGTGLIYLTVDGYERAFIFESAFERQGGTSIPRPVTRPGIRVQADRYAQPSEKFPIRLEVDNAPADSTSRVGLKSHREPQFAPDEIKSFPSSREQHLYYFVSPTGALQVRAEVRDWTLERNTKELLGTYDVQAWLLDRKGQEKDTNATLIVLDSSPPDRAEFVGKYPRSIPQGKSLVASATGEDQESGIREVHFFIGKPTPKKELPPNVELINAAPPTGRESAWTAEVPLPDKLGPVDVSVQFVNNVGLSTFRTARVDVVAPPPPPPPSGTLKVTVMRGELKQPLASVAVRDSKGTVKTMEHKGGGVFILEDLPPDTYTVTAERKENKLRGEAKATVEVNKTTEKTVDLVVVP